MIMKCTTSLFLLVGALSILVVVTAQGEKETSGSQCQPGIQPCVHSEEQPRSQGFPGVGKEKKKRNKSYPLVEASAGSPSSSEPDFVTLVVITDSGDPQETGFPQDGRQGTLINNEQPPSGSAVPGAAGGGGVSLLDIIEGHADEPESELTDDDLFPELVNLEILPQNTSGSSGTAERSSIPGGSNQFGPLDGNTGGTTQGRTQGGIPGGNIQGGIPGGSIQGGYPTGNIQGGIQGGRPGGSIQGGIQGGPPGGNIQGGIQGGPPGGNIQGGIQGGPPGGNVQGGIQGGRPGGNIQGGVQGGPPQGGIPGGIPGGRQGGVQTGPVYIDDIPSGNLPGTLPSIPGPASGPPVPISVNLTASIIEAPPPGKAAEFYGDANADLCSCTDAVPSGAFNCMQVRFQNECETPSVLSGPSDVPEGFCQITCGRCNCCTDMLTMSSRRGLDVFRRLFQTMADAQGSRSIGRSLQNPSFPTTVFAPTNDAFARMLHALNMTVEDLLEQPSLMNQIMTYHVLLGPTAASSEELATGFLGTTLPTVNAAAFVSVNATGPTLAVGGIGSHAKVIVPNVFSCRSIFHVIDEVLLPFSPDGLQMG